MNTIMTPSQPGSALRRSEIGIFRSPPTRTPVINNDEEERKQARRQSLSNEADTSTSSTTTLENNDALKSYLKIYSKNKVTKENAWSESLIDNFYHLLDRHHRSLSNFKVAGSSLEACSKLYGYRVDSIHTDVIRMSTGLNRRKNSDKINDEGNNEEVITENENSNKSVIIPKPRKKKRRQCVTVTRNIQTLNGPLATDPSSDAIFANSSAGSINSSNRLLQNILPSVDSELKLNTNSLFWNPEGAQNLIFSEELDVLGCEMERIQLLEDTELSNSVLRPIHTGHIITDNPADLDDVGRNERLISSADVNNQNLEMEMAFDINAEVEQISLDTDIILNTEMIDSNELTPEDCLLIKNLKGVHRPPVYLEDMRPVDSGCSYLEYSYRALDKISHFWAGPSYWKLKKSKNTMITQTNNRNLPVKNKKRCRKVIKPPQRVNFEITNDYKFQNLNQLELKRTNICKKWDAKKLKLPTDLQIDNNCFDAYTCFRGTRLVQEIENTASQGIPIESGVNYNNPVDQEFCSNIQNIDDYADVGNEGIIPNSEHQEGVDPNISSPTIMEIGTDVEGAPDNVTKIFAPFARRSELFDMKKLKGACLSIIQKEMTETEKETMPNPRNYPDEKYMPGMSKFSSIYKKLPKVLTTSMAEALSPSVALYSILHLESDQNLRLVQQDGLNDIQIRQLNL